MTDRRFGEGLEKLEQGRHALALEDFVTAADDADTAVERNSAVAFAAQVNLTLGRPYEAIAWAERLRADSPTPDEADLLEASAWVALGDGERALTLLGDVGIPETTHTRYDESLLPQLRCQALGLVGDVDAALMEASSALLGDWALPEIWRCLARLGADHEIDVIDAVGRIPEHGVLEVLGWLIDAHPTGADRIVEAIWNRWPGDLQVLALISALGNRLPLERALEWSARMRAVGLTDDCAVLGIAATETRPAVERVRAAAVAAATFHDTRAVPLVELAVSHLADEDVIPTFREVLELAPDDLVDTYVVAAATSARRSLLLASVLLDLGATDPAVALARHAFEQTTGQPAELKAAIAASLSGTAAARLVTELEGRGAPELAALVTGVSA